MTSPTDKSPSKAGPGSANRALVNPGNESRVFLVIVDDSEEMRVALHFACLRARHHGGRVALLHVIEPTDSQAWIAVEDLMRIERREAAEAMLAELSREVVEWSGSSPLIYLREGDVRDELLRLIEDEASISVVVLGAGTGPEGPGPLVGLLAGKLSGRLRVPITVVPGALTDRQLAALT